MSFFQYNWNNKKKQQQQQTNKIKQHSNVNKQDMEGT